MERTIIMSTAKVVDRATRQSSGSACFRRFRLSLRYQFVKSSKKDIKRGTTVYKRYPSISWRMKDTNSWPAAMMYWSRGFREDDLSSRAEASSDREQPAFYTGCKEPTKRGKQQSEHSPLWLSMRHRNSTHPFPAPNTLQEQAEGVVQWKHDGLDNSLDTILRELELVGAHHRRIDQVQAVIRYQVSSLAERKKNAISRFMISGRCQRIDGSNNPQQHTNLRQVECNTRTTTNSTRQQQQHETITTTTETTTTTRDNNTRQQQQHKAITTTTTT